MKMNTSLTFNLILLLILPSSMVYSFCFETTQLPESRQMYGTVVLGDCLYVVGGNSTSGYDDKVLKATINADGTLGRWSETTRMPQPRTYISNMTIALNDVLYVIGGWDAIQNQNLKTILWSRPGVNGDLGPWKESLTFPGEGLSCSVAVSTAGHIHLIGGYTQSDQPTNQVWSASLNADGDFVKWEAAPPLPRPIWFHNAAVVGNRVWVWSGLVTPENTSVQAEIFSAGILADGRLSVWRTELSRLPQPFYRAACTACGPYLMSFCPSYAGGVESNEVWYCALTEAGLSPWQKLQTNIKPKVYLDVSTDFRRGLIYLPGGRESTKVSDSLVGSVYYFRLSRQAIGTDEGTEATTAATYTDVKPGSSRLSYLHVKETSTDAPRGFVSYEEVRTQRLTTNLPVVVYFHSPWAKQCETQRHYLQDFQAPEYQSKVLLSWVDVTLFPQLVQQMGVFRTPCWIYYDSSGKELKRKIGILTKDELVMWLGG